MALYSYQAFLENKHQNTPFAQKTFDTLIERITDNQFPCYYARTTLLKNSLYVAFIENFDHEEDMFRQCFDVFAQYADIERDADPFRVFVLAIDVKTKDWQADNDLMWRFMHFCEQHDPMPWHEAIPQDTENADWSFSFMGMPWFFNLNSPNNTHRESRNVTETFSFVLQRTDGFEKLLKDDLDENAREMFRQTIRKDIRGRIAHYDNQTASPSLAGEADNLEHYEWRQFHLPNHNNQKPQTKCPYKAFKSLFSLV
jgi:uncharacterized protein